MNSSNSPMTTLAFALPAGPLGVGIKGNSEGLCYVNTKSNQTSPLNIGDVVVSLNGIKFAQVQGGVEAWKNIFLAFASQPRNVVVNRPDFVPPPPPSQATNAAGVASGTYKSQSSFNSSSDQEEKKEETPDEVEARRSGRKRVSTTMVIDGHTVKTNNNYVVTGFGYTFGAYQADAPKAPPKKKSKGAKIGVQPKAPRQRATYIDQRLAHNEAMKKRMVLDDARRLNFMTNHADALEPFAEDKVKYLLAANKQVAKPEPKQIPLGSQPDCVTTPLRDYQLIGLDWMVHMQQKGMPFILGDEMGLGKTLQTISLIAHLKESCGYTGPSLVICPLSVLYSWCSEVKKHAPSLKVFRFHSSDANERDAQKKTMVEEVLKYDIVVTTYEMAKAPNVCGMFRNIHFNLCVLDEGHVIKSLTSQISDAVRKIHCQTRVILTGTPLQNNLEELYAILNYLYPQFFTTPEKFADAFDIQHNQIDPDMLLKANKLLKLFMIRRLKHEVEALMPKKIETKVRWRC